MLPGGFGGPPIGFSVMFTLVFVIVIGTFMFVIIKGVSTWAQNNASPVEIRKAKVIAKRTKVSGGSGEMSASTWYYMTFEFADGERMELQVAGRLYGLVVEGDQGEVTYQGTRFQGFERKV